MEKKDVNKRKIEVLYQKETEKRERNDLFNKKISAFFANMEIQRFFKGFSNQLSLIFDFLRTNIEIDKKLNFTNAHLQYKAYVYFTLYFDVLDNVLDLSEIQQIYRSVSKDLKLKERIPIGFS